MEGSSNKLNDTAKLYLLKNENRYYCWIPGAHEHTDLIEISTFGGR